MGHKKAAKIKAELTEVQKREAQQLIEDSISRTTGRIEQLRKEKQDELLRIKHSRFRRFINNLSI